MLSLLAGSEGSILDIYQGEYYFDRYDIKLCNNRGEDRGVIVQYGKNMINFEEEDDCSNLYSHIFPYAYNEDENRYVDITYDSDPEVWHYPNVSPISGRLMQVSEESIGFSRVLMLDLTDEIDFIRASLCDAVRTEAEKYIKRNSAQLMQPNISITVSFVQLSKSTEYKKYQMLETIKLGDTVSVIYPEMGVMAKSKCVKTIYDVISDKYAEIELGRIRPDLSKSICDYSIKRLGKEEEEEE